MKFYLVGIKLVKSVECINCINYFSDVFINYYLININVY